MVERHRRVKLVKDWLGEVFDPTEQPWFRNEFIHPDEFGRYAPPERGAAATPRKVVRQVVG